ncbi:MULTISPECIES: VapE domain-containing protein [unclassified Arcicella]|uniref:VapE domain-containing protein n=1 Tax=unclassified Arcicella TaxID=2644986 RepID=UPI0028651580|nr:MULTISPECIES: VapE domain-containing protein [unclassified Arcicella]MDR6561284.1 putative P-loop ATPase [Arcicella sp. BE51]MDR6811168.1 putative P-loop ATPase [Arcicella sp. BE140]MDR6822518.1 putative P-loop ATPase [Arcicella sp. BE139]
MKQHEGVREGDVCLSDLEDELSNVIIQNSHEIKLNITTNPHETNKNDNTTLFHQTKALINKHYDLQFDKVKLELLISAKDKKLFEPLNDSNLYVFIREDGIKISKSDFREILKSDFVEKIDPFLKYFENLVPYRTNEPDYIEKLASYVSADNQQQFNLHFKKHLVRTIRCALKEDYFNKQAFILVQSGQNTGKTTFCRSLCPPELLKYYAEDITTDKDGLILLATNILINLDELSTLHKSEINALKSYFSKASINVRLPYDAKNSNIFRRASFIGSTNLAQFLTDETGSVRWLCFTINSIDWNYSKEININDVWRQAYHLYLSGFKHDLTTEEIQENELRNAQFQLISIEEELVLRYLSIPKETNQVGVEFLQATEITTYLQISSGISKINNIQIGKILNKYFKREKKVKEGMQRYGYLVIKNI